MPIQSSLQSFSSVWLYGVCTFLDVEAERDDPSVDMDTMSAPQVAIVAPGYSEAIVRELATEALESLALDDFGFPAISLEDLSQVMSASRPENGVVLELVTHDYYDLMHSCHLIRVTVQERSVRSADNQAPSLTERVSVCCTAPGDS